MVAGFLVLAWVFLCWIYAMFRIAKGTAKVVKVVAAQPQPVPFLGGYIVFLVVMFGVLVLMFAR